MSAAGVIETLNDILVLLTNPESGAGCTIDPVCRAGIYPGTEVPWDTCSETECGEGSGQLWGVLRSINPNPNNTPGSGCTLLDFTAAVGIVRCAAPMDGSRPPSIEAIEADAVQQALDADGIYRAIMCCEERSERVRDLTLSSWTALGPQGGCVGGEWAIRGQWHACC